MLSGLALLGGGTCALATVGVPYVGVGTGVVVNTGNEGQGSFRGMPLALFAGYGGRLDSNVYLAGEIFGNVNTMSLDNNGLKTTYSWGASLLPGLSLGEGVLGFARIGVLRNHFSWKNKTGGEVGAGVEVGLAREWSLRGEYDYIQYNGDYKTDQFIVGLLYRFV